MTSNVSSEQKKVQIGQGENHLVEKISTGLGGNFLEDI
jgi:hypothetical protein